MKSIQSVVKFWLKNIERFGARNVVVTNTSADKLAKVFKNYFDTIVFDGPCSGEGMFRKDPDAIQYWHNEYPSELAQLQKDNLIKRFERCSLQVDN